MPNEHYIVEELTDDLYLLTQVIATLSMDSHIIKNFNELLTVNSPFHQLHLAIGNLVNGIKKNALKRNTQSVVYNDVYTAWKACIQFENKIRESKNEYGTSLHLTVILQKIHKCLVRVNSLMQMLISHESDKDYLLLVQFAKRIVKIETNVTASATILTKPFHCLLSRLPSTQAKQASIMLPIRLKNIFKCFSILSKGVCCCIFGARKISCSVFKTSHISGYAIERIKLLLRICRHTLMAWCACY
ncbi:MAG: hypothetical protein IPJ79_04480 [Bacteroidetes bacterium]|nr:hypothetical protein [Bacteroidota bacterium]